jgi:hypothetical protein
MDPTSKKNPSLTAEERRRSPRGRVPAPIRVQVGDDQIEGTVENLSYAGVMVLSHGDLPEIGSACQVQIHLPAGDVAARGKVVRHDVRHNCFAVDLEHVDENGEVLLATLLMASGLPAGATAIDN